MDTAQWPQPTKEMERRRKRSEEPLNKYCPRCNSKHTKFCYYNNYSLTQPRYLCKTCRRYWTHGGSLRTIPVGGGGTGTSRKHKTTRSSSKNKPPLSLPPPLTTTLEAKADQDNSSSMAAFPDAASSSGFGDFIRPALGFFSLDGGDPLNQEEGTTSEMLLLPFETLKPPSSSPSSNGGIEYTYHSKRYSDDLLAYDKEEAADRSSAGFWSDMFSDESWQLYTK